MACSKKLSSAILPLGVAALVAGCGGGAMVSKAGGSTAFVPPVSPASYSGKATLTLYVPVRKPHSDQRQPRYISPGTARVDVTVVPAGAASPWPNPVSTTVPSPAPSASSIPVTMTVAAPLGSAQFAVNTYDASGYMLSGVTSTPVPISPNAASNNISLTLLASAQCVQINHTPHGTFDFAPLKSQTAGQTATFIVTPCDVDGYPIPAGQALANSISITTTYPGPLSAARHPEGQRRKMGTPTRLSFNPSTITQGGDTIVTATYPAGISSTDTQYVVPNVSGFPVSWGTVNANPWFYVLVANANSNTVSIFKDQVANGTLTSLGTIPVGSNPNIIVGHGPLQADGVTPACSGAGQAVVFSNGNATVLTFPTPGPGNLTPTPVPSTVPLIAGTTTAAAMDDACHAYVGESDNLLYELTLPNTFSVFGNGPFMNPAGGGSPTPAPLTAIAAINGGVYLGLGDSGGYMNYAVDSQNAGLYPSFATRVDAITAFGTNQIVLAYHDNAGGYLHFALYDTTSKTVINDTNSFSFATITGMIYDGTSTVYAVSPSSNAFSYQPTGQGVTGLALANAAASGLAYELESSKMYVTDSVANQIFPYNYAFSSPPPVALSTGSTPQGVVVLP